MKIGNQIGLATLLACVVAACDDSSGGVGGADAAAGTTGNSDALPFDRLDTGVTDGPADGPAIDAPAADAAPMDSAPADTAVLVDAGGADLGPAFGPGCFDGTREGLVSQSAFPGVAACAGSWTGDVSAAAATSCAAGWHVCLGSEPDLKAVNYTDAVAFEGCFAIDAVQDGYVCAPDCSAQVGVIDTAENVDMGAIGNGCTWKFANAGGCITAGRIDGSENSGTGCNYYEGLAGVVCCVNRD